MVPWTYPQGFHCPKCHNTGYKSNGKTCKDCWARFARRNPVQYAPPALAPVHIQQPGLKIPFTNYRIDDNLNFSQDQASYVVYHPPPPVANIQPQQPVVLPDEPPSYDIHETVPQGKPQYQQQQYQPQPQYPLPPRVVQPGDPSLGGVLCGRCRGKGFISGFMLPDVPCNVCQGAGRVF